ncbi:MAG TPA: family 43 glycosylhydrolase [Bacteroidaceae bacterium]|jgi:arabinan endo-1,5-alpha-L-arabinosidase|nr:family 43 glycosylhydrolase [Bacteroidaceae bacterium]
MDMRQNIKILCVGIIFSAATLNIYGQVGSPFIHDPSTIVECDGKYYTFGTGGGGLISEDGWHWSGGAVRPGGGAAPDAMKIGDRYLVAYSATGGGLGGGHAGRILTMWNKTLDPNSPDFEYTEAVVVASTVADEDCDAIDVGLMLDPTTGRLWCTYGTYYGFIRQVELDPATGFRIEGNEAIDIAIDCEASVMIYRNGWYYLLATHGTCCDGANSTYTIYVGRSRNVNGPFYDNVGRTMIEGGGRKVLSSEGRTIGPGHFGRYIVEEGVEKMSCHFEADLDQGGRSVLGIRPLLWKNDWPEAGEPFRDGIYEIETARNGYALEMTVDFVRMQGGMGGMGGGRTGTAAPQAVPNQQLSDVIDSWPQGDCQARNGYYVARPWQRWTVQAVPEAGGYLGGPYYKILIAGTDRALAATADGEVQVVYKFTGADEQLWRIDQLTDGTFRIMPKRVPGHSEPLALVSMGDCSPTLAKFNFKSDNSKWYFRHFEPLEQGD